MTRMYSCDTIIFARKREISVRLAQLDRAFGYGPKGRGFESSSAREKKNRDAKASLLFLLSGVAASLRSAQNRRPPDVVRPLAHVGWEVSKSL